MKLVRKKEKTKRKWEEKCKYLSKKMSPDEKLSSWKNAKKKTTKKKKEKLIDQTEKAITLEDMTLNQSGQLTYVYLPVKEFHREIKRKLVFYESTKINAILTFLHLNLLTAGRTITKQI